MHNPETWWGAAGRAMLALCIGAVALATWAVYMVVAVGGKAIIGLSYGVMLLIDRLRGRRTWKPYSQVEGKLL